VKETPTKAGLRSSFEPRFDLDKLIDSALTLAARCSRARATLSTIFDKSRWIYETNIRRYFSFSSYA
jgi:hypothetical protein